MRACIGISLSLGVALLLAGCTSAASQRDRTVKTYSEPDGRRHPVTFDVNADGVITCAQAQGRNGDGGCSVRDVSGAPTYLKPGGTMNVAGAGKTTLACTGSGALYCSVSIKD